MPYDADQDYLTEETRLRGARPTIRATINPASFPQEIPANEIIQPGKLYTAIPRNFQGLQLSNHVLTVNNRAAAFIPEATTCPGSPEDTIKIEHGFRLADNSVSWLTLFTGRLNSIKNSHAWGKPHNALIQSSNIIAEKLQTKIGVPASDGTRQPFMHGSYLANAELEETIPPSISTIVKTGTGTGTLAVLGVENFSGQEDINFRVMAEYTGEIGAVTFRWSSDSGQTWDDRGAYKYDGVTWDGPWITNVTAPTKLKNGLSVYWIGGLGYDVVAGDYWDFTVYAQTHKYVIPGFSFTEISSIYNNAVEIFTGFVATPVTGEIILTGSSGRLRARVVKDALTHPVDVIEDILTEVGLDTYINTLSFAAAKEATMPYNFGTRFENITAAKAIQLITQAALYFFWVDQDQIYLYAYTGNLI